MAQRTIYDAKYHPVMIQWMARSGLTQEQISFQIGITSRTLRRWRKSYKEVDNALKYGEDYVNATVEDSLLKRARGYSYIVKTIKSFGPGKSDTIITQEKEVIPDTNAITLWLMNRVPGWRNAKGLGDDITEKTTEELLSEAEELSKQIKDQGAKSE